jgi:Flp pilus assembly protein TadD
MTASACFSLVRKYSIFSSGLPRTAEVGALSLANSSSNAIRRVSVGRRAGNFGGALDFLEAAVRLWPEESEYQSACGWALHRKNPPESERAREHLEKAVALRGEDAEAHHRLGLVLKALGEEEAAKSALARARELGHTES